MEILKEYDIATYITVGKCYPSKLWQELEDANVISNVPAMQTKKGKFIIYKDATTVINDETLLDEMVRDHPGEDFISRQRENKINRINAKDEQLIHQGFEYNNLTFSLDDSTQTKLVGVYSGKDNPAMPYPMPWNTKDGLETYQLTDAADIEGMYLTALGKVKGVKDSGNALKEQVRVANNKAEIDAIIDNR